MTKFKTTNDIPCIFPFTYNDVSYESCTNVDSDHYFCLTGKAFSYDTFGKCSSDCPKYKGQYHKIPNKTQFNNYMIEI